MSPTNEPLHCIRLIYFAWVRERIGRAEEDWSNDASLETIADLIATLAQRSEGHAAAFANPTTIRVAIDQQLALHHTPIAGAREIAFFPPMTGG